MTCRLRIASAFAQTLGTCRAGRSRAAFERWQAGTLQRWLQRSLPGVEFYRGAAPRLEALPIIDKTTVMADFAAFNRGRITAEEGWRAVETAGRIGDVSIGASTGTSGNRALYAVNASEQDRWLGTILAKAVPRFLVEPERVAVILPQNSPLYDGANHSRLLRLKFFDLRRGVESWLPALEGFAPTTIVAPPRVLRHLAEHSERLKPRRLFAGAETLDPVDRTIIEARFGNQLGQIYMATEGLFAVSCAQGRLHLAEDANVFEFEPVAGGLVAPRVTGFRRRFQIMARYRMNDLLRLSDRPCACGSPLRAVDEIVGRLDDAFVFDRTDGMQLLVTPDVMRNAVLAAARTITDFRILREDPEKVALVLEPKLADASAKAAQHALSQVFSQRGLSPIVVLRREAMAFEPHRKLRRVENRCRPEDGP
ncbi:CoF synthetase [Rhizobium leguminosarum bv. trifolii]|uniref:CoF synthetase n=1 Tax=Rhizobium leguminosarum bv. trifolii TaxID=386 RepID=A0A3E1B1M6_RHILT|nr:CoF synthetase [Rhizobium leguminosarum]RFB84084.1 CoF synthetase [Rhizobium leguminosarum bv. trifolii]RFB84339.1 CoF synthetase [Rhizobium leguminosarum bv. trifolii]